MKRTTVMLPPKLRSRAIEWARGSGISLGEFIRRSMEAMLAGDGGPGAEDPLLVDDAVYDGPAPEDLAAEHDRYLYGPHK